MKWSDKYSVGLESMDKQHKRLVEMLDDFYVHIKSRSNKQSIVVLLKEMKDYTAMHFKAEEALLKKHNYPKFEEQKFSHDKFIEKVVDLEKRLETGNLILSFEVTSFLKDWLVKHIMGEDKEYGEFLVKKGEV